MTAPASTFLDSDGWPVVDRLLADAFRQLIAIPGAEVYAGTRLNAETDIDQSLWPAIRLQRLPGGGRGRDNYQDVCRIEVVTFGRTRPESDDLTAQVRRVMADLSDEEWAGVGLDRIGEDSGPGPIPDPNQDIRAVPTTWTVIVRQQD